MKLKYFVLLLIFPLSQLMGQWIPIGLESEGISSIVIDPHNPNVIYASAIFPADSEGISGIFKSTDGGTTWDTIYHGWDIQLTIHPDSSNILYATSWDVPVLKTTDAGMSWFESDSGITIGVECCGGGGIAVSPKNPEIIYAGTLCTGCGPMWRSTDGGRFWSKSLICGTVVGNDPDSGNQAYMGTAMVCDIYRSTDAGSSWLLTGFRSGIANGFAFSKPSSTVYLASSGGISFPKGIFKSTDAGMAWSNIGDGMPGIRSNVNCIVTRRKTHPEDIYIGANNFVSNHSDSGAIYGVFRSTDGGDSWYSFGLDSIRIQVLSISPNENTLYAGVLFPNYGKRAGIYKRNLVTDVRESGGDAYEFRIGQNYPNPFNPTTQITYSVTRASNVTLKVFDVLGREIAVLVNERKQAGEYKVSWNAEGVPSGVFFYRIVAGEFTQTKKMLVIH
jgi:hypothetical protein